MNSNQKTNRAYVPRQSLDLNDEQLLSGYAQLFKRIGIILSYILFFIIGLLGVLLISKSQIILGFVMILLSFVVAYLNYLFYMFFYAIIKVFSNISTTLKDIFILLAVKTDGHHDAEDPSCQK